MLKKAAGGRGNCICGGVGFAHTTTYALISALSDLFPQLLVFHSGALSRTVQSAGIVDGGKWLQFPLPDLCLRQRNVITIDQLSHSQKTETCG